MTVDNFEITKKIDHFHHASDLNRLANEVIAKMKVDRGEQTKNMQKQGVVMVNRGTESAVQCLSELFDIERNFVWLDKSQTLGLELCVMQRDPVRTMATLTLRPDGKAIVRGEREFLRSVEDPEECDAACAAFLRLVADNAMVGLPTVPF